MDLTAEIIFDTISERIAITLIEIGVAAMVVIAIIMVIWSNRLK